MSGAERLVEALASDDWSERAEAMARLQALGDRAVPVLVIGATHPDADVRAESVALMDHLADTRCVAALKSALSDRSARVRRLAVHSIGCQRCKVAPLGIDVLGLLVERASRDSSARVRRVAVHQLGLQVTDRRAIEALEDILRRESDPKLRSRAEFALRQQRATAS
jgi:HEAT repeat protein